MINFVVSLSRSRSLSVLSDRLTDYNADDCPLDLVYSNEGIEIGISNPGIPKKYTLHETDTHVIILSGYIREKGSNKVILPRELVDFADRPRANVFAGIFCLCIVNKRARTAYAWNTLSRQIPLYYSVLREGGLVLGTRASLLSVIREEGRPKVNPFHLYPFYGQGFHVLETTPFDGIQVVPANSFMTCSDAGVDISQCSDILDSFSSLPPSDELYDRLAGILSNSVAVRPYFNDSHDIDIGITGGRDSRLLFAALKKSGADFTSHTIGRNGHPDVVIGKLIAAHLNIEHRVIQKKNEQGDNFVMVNPLRQALTTLFFSDWAASGYDRLGSFRSSMRHEFSVNGAFGGLLRGGYPNIRSIGSKKNLAVFKLEKLLNDFGILSDQARKGDASKSALIKEYLSKFNSTDALDQLYLLTRAGRWASATVMATRNSVKLTPFADNEFLHEMYKLDGRFRINGVLLFELLRRYDNKLAYLPFMGKTYAFIENPPIGYEGIVHKIEKPLLSPQDSSALFNWRFALDSGIGALMEAEISKSFNSKMSELFERESVVNIVKSARLNPHDRVNGRLLWGIFSTSLTCDCFSRSEVLSIISGTEDITVPVVETKLA